MKAARIHSYGSPEVIKYEEAPVPEITSNEVLIKVRATSYNPLDTFLRSGFYKEIIPVTLPFTLSSDVSGIVEKAGKDVTNLKQGDEVFAFLNFAKNGAAAEYVAAEASDVAIAPKSIDLSSAAAVPLTALTAWQGLFEHAKLKEGDRVLINAAAGGVGVFAVQFAKLKGSYVIGTASDESAPLLKDLGIDEIINYKEQNVIEALKEKVDVVFNLVQGSVEQANSLLSLIKEGGVIISALTPPEEDLAKERGIRSVRMVVARNANQLSQIASLIDEGKVKVVITAALQLEEIAKAHEIYDAGKTRGKILITVQ